MFSRLLNNLGTFWARLIVKSLCIVFHCSHTAHSCWTQCTPFCVMRARPTTSVHASHKKPVSERPLELMNIPQYLQHELRERLQLLSGSLVIEVHQLVRQVLQVSRSTSSRVATVQTRSAVNLRFAGG
jgi:hypothetical protein